MPLKPVFGWRKHQILGGRLFETVSQPQAAVERYSHRRVEQAKERRDRAWIQVQPGPAEKSVSVL
jgi:hypothetical protein